jgi:hypothetical protein
VLPKEDYERRLNSSFKVFRASLGCIGAAVLLVFAPAVADKMLRIKLVANFDSYYAICAIAFLLGALTNYMATGFGAIRCIESRSCKAWVIVGVLLWISFVILIFAAVHHQIR